jgi:hypothetical protein
MMNYKGKVMHLENKKQERQKEKEELFLKVGATGSKCGDNSFTDYLVKVMSQINFKDDEIKKLKVENQRLQQEVVPGGERNSQIQSENETL